MRNEAVSRASCVSWLSVQSFPFSLFKAVLNFNMENPTKSNFFPMHLNASGIACWWSIKKLIEETPPGRAHFWTLTFVEQLPDNYAANMHRELMLAIAHAVRRKEWPKGWGGVKVTEVHPGGHGLHFHWVIRGEIPIRTLLALSKPFGFGRIQVDPKPATPLLANYLAGYLTKAKGEKVHGLKRWSCIGSFEGVKTSDVEFLSESVVVFRNALREAKAAGKTQAVAFNYAKQKQREFDHNHDVRDEYSVQPADDLEGDES